MAMIQVEVAGKIAYVFEIPAKRTCLGIPYFDFTKFADSAYKFPTREAAQELIDSTEAWTVYEPQVID